MLNMIKGCRIKDPAVLFEGYQRLETGFVANVNADKILSVLQSFVLLHNEFCFTQGFYERKRVLYHVI